MTFRVYRTRRYTAWALAVLALAVTGAGPQARPSDSVPLSIRITSPLGRTGAAGVVRIVAQVTEAGAAVGARPGSDTRKTPAS